MKNVQDLNAVTDRTIEDELVSEPLNRIPAEVSKPRLRRHPGHGGKLRSRCLKSGKEPAGNGRTRMKLEICGVF